MGQYLLAIGYRSGVGVPQDPVAALQWFLLAAAQGQLDAAKQRDELAATMSRPDAAKAQKQAQDWRPTWEPQQSP
jgi:TPR repeat protein